MNTGLWKNKEDGSILTFDGMLKQAERLYGGIDSLEKHYEILEV